MYVYINVLKILSQSVRTTASKHPIDYKRKYLGIKRMVKQLVFVCINTLLFLFDIAISVFLWAYTSILVVKATLSHQKIF